MEYLVVFKNVSRWDWTSVSSAGITIKTFQPWGKGCRNHSCRKGMSLQHEFHATNINLEVVDGMTNGATTIWRHTTASSIPYGDIAKPRLSTEPKSHCLFKMWSNRTATRVSGRDISELLILRIHLSPRYLYSRITFLCTVLLSNSLLDISIYTVAGSSHLFYCLICIWHYSSSTHICIWSSSRVIEVSVVLARSFCMRNADGHEGSRLVPSEISHPTLNHLCDGCNF